jgi:hypothetical protein
MTLSIFCNLPSHKVCSRQEYVGDTVPSLVNLMLVTGSLTAVVTTAFEGGAGDLQKTLVSWQAWEHKFIFEPPARSEVSETLTTETSTSCKIMLYHMPL